jgi:iron complex outermembrane receptor protein
MYALTFTSALYMLALPAYAADQSLLGSSGENTASAQGAAIQPQTQPSSQAGSSNLLNMSLQQLSDVEVTSVSKKAEKESQAPAAIYVITQEDIRRSGLQSIPELLRMVPGLQVAQSGSGNWAITSRGFDGQFANKLLVLIDGRTVYSPVYSGVYWDVQNVMLEDIDRIEVIRGPGATLWGANAVNGVINIITKSAKDTQGTLITAATGNQERASVAGRYGGKEGDLSYRTYAQYFNDNQEHLVSNPLFDIHNGEGAQDQWHNQQGGFRLDWDGGQKDQETVQGDVYSGQENALRFLPVTSTVNPNMYNVVDDTDDQSGMNILGRWTHEFNPDSKTTIQAYYDDFNLESENIGSSQHTQTFDFDFQHDLTVNDRNDVTWGLGYRFINSDFGNGFYIGFNPENYDENLFSGFLQDKIALLPDKVFLTLGTKLEHNDFSGFEYEPSARLSWIPTENQTLWASVSRAVQAPTQSGQNINLVLGSSPTPAPYNAIAPTNILIEQGNPMAESEDVLAYELGYRIQPRENLSFDLTGYVNEYTHLSSLTQGTTTLQYDSVMGAYFVTPEIAENANRGETHGFEATSTWEVTRYFKLSGGYTLYYSELHITGASLVTSQGNAPNQQFNIRSYLDLPHNVQFDTMLYYVDTLPAVNNGFGGVTAVPDYTRLDMRLGWTPLKGLDLSLIGQNLLQSEHAEFSPFLYQTSEEIGRSVIAKATVRF